MAQDAILGCIYMFAGNFAPRNYALCQGQLLSISQNAALFSILGTTYGGNGTTTFALPDLRGRAPIGEGTGPGLTTVVLGEQGGTQNVTLLSSQMPAHTHGIGTSGASDLATPVGNLPGDLGISATFTIYGATADGAPMAAQSIAPTGGSQPFSVQDPFLGITFIIATQGIFPSRN
jgi:microcystin-dependent protein